MDNALLLHGWYGHSNENWFPWLKRELERRLYDVYIPNLPNSKNPILEEQIDYIDIYAGDFKKGGLIVGHSLGCQLAMNFITDNNIKNSVIILVSPTYPKLIDDVNIEVFGESFDYIDAYLSKELDFDKLNKLDNKYVVFLSEDDPYINYNNSKKYFKNLKSVEFVKFKDKGHFNKKAGVMELEEIVEFLYF